MNVFPGGLIITRVEYQCLQYLTVDPAQWLIDTLHEKAQHRRDALITEQLPRLLTDPSIRDIPANSDVLAELIMSRADYVTREQADTARNPLERMAHRNIDRFEARRVVGERVTLFPAGLEITDLEHASIMAYIQDLDDWLLGALLGQINRGKKKIIRQYRPVLFDDPTVLSMPADDDDLVALIVQRADYRTLPEQIQERGARRDADTKRT